MSARLREPATSGAGSTVAGIAAGARRLSMGKSIRLTPGGSLLRFRQALTFVGSLLRYKFDGFNILNAKTGYVGDGRFHANPPKNPDIDAFHHTGNRRRMRRLGGQTAKNRQWK